MANVVSETLGNGNGSGLTKTSLQEAKKRENVASDARHEALIRDAHPTFDCSKDTPWDACWWGLDYVRQVQDHLTWFQSRISAVKSFLHVRVDAIDSEGGRVPTVDWMIDNIDTVAEQWKRRNENWGDTAATYKTRILGLLNLYKSRCTDPAFNPAKQLGAVKRAEKPEKSDQSDEVAMARKTKKVEAVSPPVSADTIQIPMGSGQVARVLLPFVQSEMTFEQLSTLVLGLTSLSSFKTLDAKRLVGRLVSQASDYEFDKGLSEQLFAKAEDLSKL